MKDVKTTWKHIRRTPYQAMVAIVILSLTFLCISFFTFIVLGSSMVMQYFESRPQLTAFFKDDAQQQDFDALKAQLEKTGKVSSIKFVSKKDALQIYRNQNKNDPLLLDLVSEDILPPSFEISTVSITDMGSI